MNNVPTANPSYVPWGNYDKILKIVASKRFFPVWITGQAGNGKTTMVEEVCAKLDREFYRVNFTAETTEDDLFGGFQLENGNTVFHEGAVTMAMKSGGVLLLDEVDVANPNRVLSLQSLMEGKGVLVKSTGEYIKPEPGFTVFATSNTKGRGSDDGRYVGTSVMNAAFLDRFAGMLYQDYPPEDIETEILQNSWYNFVWDNADVSKIDKSSVDVAGKFIASVIFWANQIRENFKKGSAEEVITTRTLISVVKAYAIFGDTQMALEMACERYSDATKESFISMYGKLQDMEMVEQKKS